MNINRFQIEKNIWKICIDNEFIGNIIKNNIDNKFRFIVKFNKILYPGSEECDYSNYNLAENYIIREYREVYLKTLGFEEIIESQKKNIICL